MRFVLAHERAPLTRFVAIKSGEGRALAAKHGVDPDDPSSFLLIDAGQAWRESDAALRLTRYLAAPWSWLAGLRFVPRPLRDAAYRLIARHRYRLFGRSDACIVPGAETRARFVLDDASNNSGET